MLTLQPTGNYFAFDETECAAAGAALHDDYIAGDPFPHVVIDDFIDASLLRDIAVNFPPRD